MNKGPDRLIKGPEVDAMFAIEKTSRYRYIKRGIIPKPIQIVGTAARWSYLECLRAIETLKAGSRGPAPVPTADRAARIRKLTEEFEAAMAALQGNSPDS